MSSRVLVAPVLLLDSLLESVAEHAARLQQATSPAERVDIASARAHWRELQALVALLDEMGWTTEHHPGSYELDIAAHGAAATSALRAYAQRQQQAIHDQIASGAAERSSEWMRRRLAVLQTIDLLDEASRQAGGRG